MSKYTNGYLTVMHHAGLSHTKTALQIDMNFGGDSVLDEPETYVGAAGIGLGGAGAIGGHRVRNYAKNLVLDDASRSGLEQFKRKANQGNMSLGEYAARGSDLLNSKLTMGDGTQRSGYDVINNLRTGRMSNLLERSGMMPKYDEASALHYKKFNEGAVSAGRHMFEESSGVDPNSIRSDILGRRYEAMRSIADTPDATPGMYRRALVAGSEDGRARSLMSVDKALEAADPDLYKRHMEAVLRGDDATSLQDDLYRRARLPEGTDSGAYASDRISAYLKRRGLTEESISALPLDKRIAVMESIMDEGAHDDILRMSAEKMKPHYRNYAQSYTNIIDPILGRDNLNRGLVRHGGRLRAAGLGAAGLGAALLGKGVYDADQSEGFNGSVRW